jgi:hypothetical protein
LGLGAGERQGNCCQIAIPEVSLFPVVSKNNLQISRSRFNKELKFVKFINVRNYLNLAETLTFHECENNGISSKPQKLHGFHIPWCNVSTLLIAWLWGA